MQRSSIGKFLRYCSVQYEGMFNTIERVVFIEQNQGQQTEKMGYYLSYKSK